DAEPATMQFSPDGQLLITESGRDNGRERNTWGSRGNGYLWSLKTGKQLCFFKFTDNSQFYWDADPDHIFHFTPDSRFFTEKEWNGELRKTETCQNLSEGKGEWEVVNTSSWNIRLEHRILADSSNNGSSEYRSEKQGLGDNHKISDNPQFDTDDNIKELLA